MRKLALIVAAGLAASACAALPAISAASSIVSGISSAGDTVVVKGTQALIVAEYAYNSAATAANATAKACLEVPSLPCPITPARATQLRALNSKATAILVEGKDARDDASKAIAARDLMAIVATIDSLRK